MSEVASEYYHLLNSHISALGECFWESISRSSSLVEKANSKCMWVPLLIPVVYYSLRYIRELFTVDQLANRVIFIAGSDSGFGHLLAIKCASKGMTVFAGCLTQESRQKLESKNLVLIGKIFPLELDVTSEESVIAAKDYVQANMLPGQYFWALVNNAGFFAWFGPDAWVSIEHYQKSMNVNVYGMIRCVHAFLPLIKQSQGRIISMSSMSGRYPQAYGITYCMAKYAVEAYMDGIRQELLPYNITCCMLEPGAFNTNFLSMTAMKQRVEDVWNQQSPTIQQEYGEQFKENYLKDFEAIIQSSSSKLHNVVNAYYHAITGRWPRLRYRIGWDCQLFVSLSFLPTELSDLALRFLANTYRVPAILQKKRK